MNPPPPATPKFEENLRRLQKLWPALKGSLAKVAKPCIRKNCRACRRGDKHPAWLLTFRQGERRRGLYVPLALVPTLRRALKNGRLIEKLLYRMGPQMVQAYRRTRKKKAGAGKTPPKS